MASFVMRLILAVQVILIASCVNAAPIFKGGADLACGELSTEFTTAVNFKILGDCTLNILKPAVTAMRAFEDSHFPIPDFSSEVIREVVEASPLLKRIDTAIPFVPVGAPAPAMIMAKIEALPVIKPRSATPQQDGGQPDCGKDMQCAGMPTKRDPTPQQDFTPECESGDHKQCAGSYKRDPVAQQDDSPPYCTRFGNQCGGSNDGSHRDPTPI